MIALPVSIGWAAFALHARELPQKKVLPFELDQVRLLPGPFKSAMDRKCS